MSIDCITAHERDAVLPVGERCPVHVVAICSSRARTFLLICTATHGKGGQGKESSGEGGGMETGHERAIQRSGGWRKSQSKSRTHKPEAQRDHVGSLARPRPLTSVVRCPVWASRKINEPPLAKMRWLRVGAFPDGGPGLRRGGGWNRPPSSITPT